MAAEEPRDPAGEKPLRVRRGRVDSLDLFEIKDSELDALERGPADFQLAFATFLLSLAFSAICTLATTTTFVSENVKIIFLIVPVVGILMGVYLLASWFRARRSVSAICKRIRERIPPDIPTRSPEAPTGQIPPAANVD
jgi:hypothetical protein